jgi:hypothetical protein
MYEISSSLYLDIADRLVAAIGGKEFFSGVVTVQSGDVECRLICTLIVERSRGVEGTSFPAISNLLPIWWECHTLIGGEELLNDFCFSELKASIL